MIKLLHLQRIAKVALDFQVILFGDSLTIHGELQTLSKKKKPWAVLGEFPLFLIIETTTQMIKPQFQHHNCLATIYHSL